MVDDTTALVHRAGVRVEFEKHAVTASLPRIGTAVALALTVSGCAAPRSRAVTRLVRGTPHEGALVSAYEFEWYTRGELARYEGRIEAAQAALTRATLGANEDAFVLSRLAEVVANTDPERAARLLARAEAADPRSEAAALSRGRIAAADGRVDDAIAAYRVALDRAAGSTTSLAALAEALLARGATDEAWTQLGTHPQDSLTLGRLRFLVAIARADEDAIAHAAGHLAATWSPGERDVRDAIEVAFASGDDARAALLLGALPRPTEDDETRRALAFARTGRGDDALRLRATSLAARDPLASAELDLALGRPGDALETLASVLDTTPDPRGMRLRGEALFALGRVDEAIRALESVPVGTSERPLALAALETHLRSAGRPHEADRVRQERARLE